MKHATRAISEEPQTIIHVDDDDEPTSERRPHKEERPCWQPSPGPIQEDEVLVSSNLPKDHPLPSFDENLARVLDTLMALFEEGLISQEEYDQRKNALLDRAAAQNQGTPEPVCLDSGLASSSSHSTSEPSDWVQRQPKSSMFVSHAVWSPVKPFSTWAVHDAADNTKKVELAVQQAIEDAAREEHEAQLEAELVAQKAIEDAAREEREAPVSYTHLTLPTRCSV
eukprot:1249195-Prymnesium_polylepis.3